MYAIKQIIQGQPHSTYVNEVVSHIPWLLKNLFAMTTCCLLDQSKWFVLSWQTLYYYLPVTLHFWLVCASVTFSPTRVWASGGQSQNLLFFYSHIFQLDLWRYFQLSKCNQAGRKKDSTCDQGNQKSINQPIQPLRLKVRYDFSSWKIWSIEWYRVPDMATGDPRWLGEHGARDQKAGSSAWQVIR